jgi:hypothetical protein
MQIFYYFQIYFLVIVYHKFHQIYINLVYKSWNFLMLIKRMMEVFFAAYFLDERKSLILLLIYNFI